MRPSALATRLGISKQALNHLLGQLEKLGYLKRRCEGGTGHVVVRFTERGWGLSKPTSAPFANLKPTGNASLASNGSPTSRRA
jgi:hypothetical protein